MELPIVRGPRVGDGIRGTCVCLVVLFQEDVEGDRRRGDVADGEPAVQARPQRQCLPTGEWQRAAYGPKDILEEAIPPDRTCE